MALLCVCCFAFRAALLFVYGGDVSSYFSVSIVYYIAAEIAPTLLMLLIYWQLLRRSEDYIHDVAEDTLVSQLVGTAAPSQSAFTSRPALPSRDYQQLRANAIV